VTAAFELTRPEHAGKYEVTVYQQGFRLGGKGASGRGPADRIEEHGLHLWMGFYENAFRVMRECYAELGRDPSACRIADWRDAFVADPFCGVMDRSPSGNWLPWVVHFPPMPGLPGDADGAARFTVADYLGRSVSLVLTLLRAVGTRVGAPDDHAVAAGSPASGMGPDAAVRALSRWLRYGELATLTGIIQATELLDLVVRNLPAYPRDLILSFHGQIAGAARAQLHARTEADDELRRLWEIIDLTLAAIRGIIRFGLVNDPRGFDAIDEYDCKEWLKINGASASSVDGAFLRALYDLAFAYEDGDTSRPRIAAGQALRGAVRAFFTYRGAFFWKMQSGMGDVVFAPFYEVLKKRGVKFEFFHRLTNVALAPADAETAPHVRELEFDVQARVKEGADYRPLIDVRGLPCWPSSPDWEQLEDGAQLRADNRAFESHWDSRRVSTRALKVQEDFDLVVLAIGLGAVPHVARELVEKSERWQTMVRTCKTVSTQAFQLWMTVDMKELGWSSPPINVSGFVEPFDTWADMRQLIAEESFEAPTRAIAYFCSVLPDPPVGTDIARSTYPSERHAEVRNNVVAFLNRDVVHLWPRALRAPGQFRWEILRAPTDSAQEVSGVPPFAEDRLNTQYWTANVNPSDRYALSLPGSLKQRISPLDEDFDNLVVAGDWTDSGFNEGCVEAAVMSGRLAAHAISQRPPLEDIVGYDHP
jgi:uncharacterized protein with NAD-binding domain and iron-sulfur cluster